LRYLAQTAAPNRRSALPTSGACSSSEQTAGIGANPRLSSARSFLRTCPSREFGADVLAPVDDLEIPWSRYRQSSFCRFRYCKTDLGPSTHRDLEGGAPQEVVSSVRCETHQCKSYRICRSHLWELADVRSCGKGENGVTLQRSAGDRVDVIGDRDLLFDAISNRQRDQSRR